MESRVFWYVEGGGKVVWGSVMVLKEVFGLIVQIVFFDSFEMSKSGYHYENQYQDW